MKSFHHSTIYCNLKTLNARSIEAVSSLIICYILLPFSGLGQNLNISTLYTLPEYEPVYPQSEVSEIRIFMDQDSLDDLLLQENWYNDHEYPATFIFNSSSLTDTVQNVGIRLRGNTSREMAKKSFKVSFNTFFPRKWNGLEKLNLNGNVNDPSLMRTKLCWDMMREAGLPGARVSYVKLFINDQYKGVYVNTEHIDENFAKKYFDDQGDGNLYKCLYPADLAYLGTSNNAYKLEVFGRRVYELKNNQWIDNYADISTFIQSIQNFNSTNGKCNFEASFDLDLYLRYAALEILQGHWDGHIFNKNNFYLYKNEITGKITWIPYDLDNTLGIDWIGENWASRNIYDWSNQSRPLYDLIISEPEYKNKLSYYISTFATSFFTEQWLQSKIDLYQNLIGTAIQDDPYYSLDFGFTINDFFQADNTAWGGHVDFGIIDFANTRRFTALSQLDDVVPFSPSILVNDNGPSNGLVAIDVETESNASVTLEITIDDNTSIQEVTLEDDGVYPDNIANDNVYNYLGEFEGANRINYRAKINSVYDGCDDHIVWLTPSPSTLRINEVMSKNVSQNSDEFNEFDDWIELNASGVTGSNMSSCFLTDEFGNWNKWPLPSQIIPSGGFRLIWADNSPEQGIFHTNFRLSDNGETLWLIRYDMGAPRLIDAIYYPALNPNESFGRLTEGNSNWLIQESPTPLAPNGTVNVIEMQSSSLIVYPNPSEGQLFLSHPTSVVFYDLTGKILLQEKNVSEIDISLFESGIYLLDTPEGVFKVFIK